MLLFLKSGNSSAIPASNTSSEIKGSFHCEKPSKINELFNFLQMSTFMTKEAPYFFCYVDNTIYVLPAYVPKHCILIFSINKRIDLQHLWLRMDEFSETDWCKLENVTQAELLKR